ncbi:Homogentisate 12-dioxygenase [Macrophomina phaseolina MS6]|uniref:homogentisate 1,2-dioxygenase n=1 Tax=Macrophomina phaseolina (strain MS6) TaxID=1126212 RepID=K2S0X3_MACPH|nr:Homogentisate 12-dioxygenase [Macrophomina phaseolina MS6]
MPQSHFAVPDPFEYLAGLNAYHQSEAAPGVIPVGTTFLQRQKHDLYPERLSGTSFTTQRKDNKQTALYRLLPSTCHSNFVDVSDQYPYLRFDTASLKFKPNQARWAPVSIDEKEDFVTGLRLIGGAGNPTLKTGVAYYVYTAGKSMPKNHTFDSGDGDFCIVAQKGAMDIRTELGCLRVRENELCVIPRGVRFHISLPAGSVRGFVLECFSGHFDLPELGPIGSCGLANVRDFEVPVANYIDSDEDTVMLSKFAGSIHQATYRSSVFNVVAWHGTYYPFKYDLGKFNAMGSVSFDHPDPSIGTVLTCPSNNPGQAAADVVVFGPRWLVMEDSFRQPRYHRNTMSEFVFLVKGSFDIEPMPAQLAGMFVLTNSMTAHGADSEAFERNTRKPLAPEKIDENNLGLMFESCFMVGTSLWAESVAKRLPSRQNAVQAFKKAHVTEPHL